MLKLFFLHLYVNETWLFLCHMHAIVVPKQLYFRTINHEVP